MFILVEGSAEHSHADLCHAFMSYTICVNVTKRKVEILFKTVRSVCIVFAEVYACVFLNLANRFECVRLYARV